MRTPMKLYYYYSMRTMKKALNWRNFFQYSSLFIYSSLNILPNILLSTQYPRRIRHEGGFLRWSSMTCYVRVMLTVPSAKSYPTLTQSFLHRLHLRLLLFLLAPTAEDLSYEELERAFGGNSEKQLLQELFDELDVDRNGRF